MADQHDIVLYRMVLPDHVCPYGLLAKRMLEDTGLSFDDRLLTSRDEVEAFTTEQDVPSTPQAFTDGEPIGGSDELAEFLKDAEAEAEAS